MIRFFSEDCTYRHQTIRSDKRWLKSVAKSEGSALRDINIIFCSDEYLRELNIKHLDHHTLTDILTFEYQQDPIDGDLFISVDRVKDNATHLQVTFLAELQRVMVHGILHLCGYRDKSKLDQSLMRSKEDYYLQMRSLVT